MHHRSKEKSQLGTCHAAAASTREFQAMETRSFRCTCLAVFVILIASHEQSATMWLGLLQKLQKLQHVQECKPWRLFKPGHGSGGTP